MDIYQCMHCGDRWAHGGMRDSFVRAATHAEETRGNPEGMHMVLVGDLDRLEAQYERIQSGQEKFPSFNDQNDPTPRPEPPPMPPEQLRVIAKKLGTSNIDEVQAFVQKMRELLEPPEDDGYFQSALEDIPPKGGKVDIW